MTSELKEEFSLFIQDMTGQEKTFSLAECLSGYRPVSCLQDDPCKKTYLMEDRQGQRLLCKYACGEYTKMLKAEYAFYRARKLSFLPCVISYQEAEDEAILLREYIEGQTLSEKVEKDGPLSPDEALAVIRQVCRFLSCFHGMTPPVIYRDVKPSNIVMTKEGDCYLVDTGTVRRYQEDIISDTVCMGTADCAAPEQFGARQTDPRTDIYGLGILFYYLLTGELKIREALLSKLPGKISSIIKKCTAFNPDERYADTARLERALNGLKPDKKTLFLRAAIAASCALFAALCCLLIIPPIMDAKKEVVFSSPLLEQAVRTELHKAEDEPVYTSDLERIVSLRICGGFVIDADADHQAFYDPHHVNYEESGTGDIRDLSLLAKMPNLRHLILDYQQIYDISALKGLQLITLSLAGNPVTDLSPLAGCESLYSLDISHTGVHSLEPLSGCTCLVKLNCSCAPVTALSPLSGLNIIELGIQDIPASDYEVLTTLPVTRLECRSLPASALPLLAQMPDLQELFLYRSGITSLEALSGLTSLSGLWISTNSLKSLDGIESFKSLVYLDIGYNPVSDASILATQKNLRSLRLENTGISDFSFLNSMPEVTDVCISENQLPLLLQAVPEPWFDILY